MTKRVLLVLVVAAALAFGDRPARAIAPELLSYQGVLLQNDGIAVPDGVYDLRFRLFDQQTGGTHLFEQTLSAQVVHGLYNVILSSNGGYDLAGVVTQNSQLFIEVTVKAKPPGVPSDVTLLPRQQLASVPYALSETPSLVSGQILSLATQASIPANADWTTVPTLEGLVLDVPSPGCVVDVRADVVVGNSTLSSTRIVGARLEQSLNGGAYTVVRGPAVVTVPGPTTTGTMASSVTTGHVIANLTPGTYAYRVRVREDTSTNPPSFLVSPLVGVLQSESTLSAKLWCP